MTRPGQAQHRSYGMITTVDRKKLVITIIVTAVVVVAVGTELLIHHGSAPNAGSAPGESASSSSETVEPVVTRTAVPAGVAVPEGAATSATPGEGTPTAVAPADPTDSASYRSFVVKVSNDAFSPKGIAVYAGDTVRLSLVAEDKPYDFTLPDYGVRVPLPQGRTTHVQFSPNATGKFLFYCTSCGGPRSGPTGSLISVAPHR